MKTHPIIAWHEAGVEVDVACDQGLIVTGTIHSFAIHHPPGDVMSGQVTWLLIAREGAKEGDEEVYIPGGSILMVAMKGKADGEA